MADLKKKRRRPLYPSVEEAERERSRWKRHDDDRDEEPDFIPGIHICPNYAKWPNKTTEEILIMLNID